MIEDKTFIPLPEIDFRNLTIKNAEGLHLSAFTRVGFKYEPQSDITAYELSLILPYLLGSWMNQTDWDNLGEATRHLKRL